MTRLLCHISVSVAGVGERLSDNLARVSEIIAVGRW